MPLMSTLTDFGLGVVLGCLGGVFGIGGGLMAIPVLVWLLAMNQQLAQGTALVMIAPNVLLGFWRYRQHNAIEVKPVVVLGLFSIVSTYAAAKLASHLDAQTMRWLFAWFLMGLGAFLLYDIANRRAVHVSKVVLSDRWFPLLGLISGVFSGLFTVGGGLVVAPTLMKFFGVKKQTLAQGLALATVTPGAVIALMTYAAAGKVDWAVGVPLAMGGMVSIRWGVDMAHRLPEKLLRLLFCGLIVATGLLLL